MKKIAILGLVCALLCFMAACTNGNAGMSTDGAPEVRGVESIFLTESNGLVDTYTITYTDGSYTTFTVTNGAQGIQGIKGDAGEKGADGAAGKDGHSPVITIQKGNWFIDGVDTNQPAEGLRGEVGNGISAIYMSGSDGLVDTYTVVYTDGTSTLFTVTNGAQGAQGPQGVQGIQGVPGEKGEDGHTPVITIQQGNWYIDGVDTTQPALGVKGDTGNGISSVKKTNTAGLVDTYTITYTDGSYTTFTVTNGAQGVQGIQGVPGASGHTPEITLQNGRWYVDGRDTGVYATYLSCEHRYGEYVTDLEAACSFTGLKHRTCTLCGAAEYTSIAALEHVKGAERVYADDCSFMLVASTCTVCEGVLFEERVSDHAYMTIEYTGALCCTDGLSVQECTKCHEVRETVLSASYAHNYDGDRCYCGNYKPTEGFVIEYLESDGWGGGAGYYITGYEGSLTVTDLYLPSTHYTEEHGNGAVIGIFQEAFYDYSECFDAVYFSTTIKTVGFGAFYTVTPRAYYLNEGLEVINAFGLGYISEDLTVPASVRAIDTAFAISSTKETYIRFEGDMPSFISYARQNTEDNNDMFDRCLVIYDPRTEGWPEESGTTLYGGVLFSREDYSYDSYEPSTLIQAELSFDLAYKMAQDIYGRYDIDYRMLRIAKNDEEYEAFRTLALEITKDCTTDDERIMAIYSWVSENIIYDMGSIELSAYDSLLAGRGVCAQYTAIMTQLLRTLNIKALMVTGYVFDLAYPNEITYIDENYAEIEGHAWVVAYNGYAWSTYDPTNKMYGTKYSDFGATLLAVSIEGLAIAGDGYYPCAMMGASALYIRNGEWYIKNEDGYAIPLKGFDKVYYENNVIPSGGVHYGTAYGCLINQCDSVDYLVWLDADGNQIHGLVENYNGGYVYIYENGRVHEGIIVINGVEYQSEWS